MGDGFEKFQVTEEDYQDAFDPLARKRRKFTKEDATYGVWADKDSDEEDNRKGFGKRDYSAPMSFVSGGVKVEEPSQKQGASDIVDEDIIMTDSQKPKSSSRAQGRNNKKSNSFAGLGPLTDKHFATWEKHTKGIGQKLLGKMGYRVGEGLGKEGTGIAKPIEVTVRKGKGAIGAYGSEKINDPRQVEESTVHEVLRTVLHKKQWKKKDGVGTPVYQYRTMEDVLEDKDAKAAGGWDTSDLSKVKVIDMTGKETRVLSGYHAMHTQREFDGDGEITRDFDVPELRHNLDLLIDMSEARIIESNKKLEYEKNLLMSLQEEERNLAEDRAKDGVQTGRLAGILELIDGLVLRHDSLTLEECESRFQDLHDNCYEDYRWFELDQLAAAIVGPVMKRHFMHWEPLSDPEFGYREMETWKRLLEPPQRSFEASRNSTNSFHNVLWEVWMPFVQGAILRWSPKNSLERDPIIELVCAWESLLPQWMHDNILELQVLPKLVAEIEEWDPTQDVIPVHHWIHPWLPSLGSRLEVLYGTIRHKLSTALTRWHPSDQSALLMLQPWISIFSKATMDQFLIKNILPKLQELLEAFVVDPRNQIEEPWKWVMEWKDLMPLSSMAALLERHFFPKWLVILRLWLAKPGSDLADISKWYQGWKKLIPEQIRSHPSVEEQLTVALYAMNESVFGESVTGNYIPPPPPPPLLAQPPPPPAPHLNVSGGFIGSAPTFRGMVENEAHEKGIVFVPLPGRNFQGKQVFRFGRSLVYIDRDVVFVHRAGQWLPVDFRELINENNT